MRHHGFRGGHLYFVERRRRPLLISRHLIRSIICNQIDRNFRQILILGLPINIDDLGHVCRCHILIIRLVRLRAPLNKLVQLRVIFILDVLQLQLDVDLVLIPLNRNGQRLAELLLLVVGAVSIDVLLEAGEHLSLLLLLFTNTQRIRILIFAAGAAAIYLGSGRLPVNLVPLSRWRSYIVSQLDLAGRALIHIGLKLHFERPPQASLIYVKLLTRLMEAYLLQDHIPVLIPRPDLTAPYSLTFGILVHRAVLWEPLLPLRILLTMLVDLSFLVGTGD